VVSHDGELWFEPYRLVVVAGKGGVGKTTVAASLARAAAAAGRSVLVIDTEGKRGLAAALGAERLRYEPHQVVPPGDGTAEVWGRSIRPDRALRDYLDSHGLRRISKRLSRSGLFEMVSTGTPGIKDVLVLGKVRAIVDDGDADLVVVDGPAAGHAISFLRAARDVLDMVDSGPIHRQARQVFDLLSDHDRTAIVLVTLAEHTPVNELSETAFALEDQLHLELAPIVVNGLEPAGWIDLGTSTRAAARRSGVDLAPATLAALDDVARSRLRRAARQHEERERLAGLLPLPQILLPHVADATDPVTVTERLAPHLARVEVAGGRSRP
jgi:anion-transporting  ArsA/GET3 family ATPase